MNDIIYSKNKSKRLSLNEHNLRSQSELIFNNFSILPRSKKHSVSRRLSKQIAHAEALNLYHQLDLADGETEKNDVFLSESFSHCACDDILKSSLPSSYSSDASSATNSTVSSSTLPVDVFLTETLYQNVGSLRFKLKRKSYKGKNATLSAASFLTSASNTDSFNKSVSFTSTPNHILHRSFSVNSSSKTPRRKRPSLFGRSPDVWSNPIMSIQASPSGGNDVKTPSPERFTVMYHAARKAVSEHISVNTAELNVLKMRLQETNRRSTAHTYDIEKVVTHLERVIKKLQYQQTQLDEIHEAYVLQQRYRDGANKLKSALNSSRVSSKSSRQELKADLNRSTETLCTLEQELVGLLGRFHFEMKGLLGFAKLRSGDQYEIVLRLGSQKWRMKGAVKSFNDQTWDNTHSNMQPLLSEIINVKVMEIKLLGKHSTVGNVVCETKDLFQVEPQDLTIELNDTATLKLNLKVQWSPFDGYEIPIRSNSATSGWTSEHSRSRAKSVAERPSGSHLGPRSRFSSTFSRPLSAIYANVPNSNNSNNRNLKISAPINARNDLNTVKAKPVEIFHRKNVLSEEDAFMNAITNNLQLATLAESELNDLIPKTDSKKNSASDISLSMRLLLAVTKLNCELDDYRGRYEALMPLEDIIIKLRDRITVDHSSSVLFDQFPSLVLEQSENSRLVTDLTLLGYRFCGKKYLHHVSTNGKTKAGLTTKKTPKCFEEGNLPTTGNRICDEALLPHLHHVQSLLKDVGIYGPLKVREVIAFDKLRKQADILAKIYCLATSKKEIVFDEMEEFAKRRMLLEIWRSCCDGNTLLCVSSKTLRLELTAAFGREVNTKHADVADQVFPELVRRILDRRDVTDVDMETVTLFHVSSYVDENGEAQDFAKLVEKLALEMFITSTLSCGIQSLVLVAIKRISSLLALRISNLRALSHLLLDADHKIRTAAAVHIRHISTEPQLREKALVSYAELLESDLNFDRQCSCIALGFLGAKQCIPQLAYIYQNDTDVSVREAASNVLISMGDEGLEAKDHISSTLLVQTRAQKLNIRDSSARIGTAL